MRLTGIYLVLLDASSKEISYRVDHSGTERLPFS
jgi:hypothetical protein